MKITQIVFFFICVYLRASAVPDFFTTSHACRYNRHYHLTGHVWQGRSQAFPIEQDEHLVTVLRYVERNPLRANLVAGAEDWPWSSLGERLAPLLLSFIHPGPVPLPDAWAKQVNEPHTESELTRLRYAVQRGCPFGSEGWVKDTATRLGLESTLRPRGRPPTPRQPAPSSGQPFLFGKE